MSVTPAAYATRFRIEIAPNGNTKLLFGESDGGGADVFHVGAVLGLADVKEFAGVLAATIAQHEAKPAIAAAGENVKPIR
jgi:hypothetical protein